jgi:dTDP-glucose 4,6-dehydratase
MLLVTGCAGFIGSNFVHFYLTRHREDLIVGLDKLTYAGNLENLESLGEEEKKRFVFVRGDVADQAVVEEVFSRYDPDWIVHFAAETHVDRSLYDPEVFVRTNVLGTQVLLETARKFWQKEGKWREGKRFLHISTDEVYGETLEGKFTEESPLCPRSPYAASKAGADLLVLAYCTTYRMPAIITRCTNNYGPYQFPEKLIPLMIWNALNHRELPVYGDGRQRREWIYVLDHCEALELVLKQGRTGEVYNIGSGEEKENLEVVREIIALLREKTGDPKIHEGLIRYVQDRPAHDRRYALDSGKIRKELGFAPRTSFSEGLRKTVEWYLANRSWVERVVSGEYQEFYRRHYGG